MVGKEGGYGYGGKGRSETTVMGEEGGRQQC